MVCQNYNLKGVVMRVRIIIFLIALVVVILDKNGFFDKIKKALDDNRIEKTVDGCRSEEEVFQLDENCKFQLDENQILRAFLT